MIGHGTTFWFTIPDEPTTNDQKIIEYDMAKQEKKLTKVKVKKVISVPINDGMNTPVPEITATYVPSEIEAALLKQANNPLGDPDKI